MFTTGSKYFFGVSAVLLVAALFYGGATAPNEVGMSTFTGVLSFGYKGPVGDHVGYAVLMGAAGAALFLGCVVVAFRDADAEAGAQLLALDSVPDAGPRPTASYWPVIAAFGAAVTVVGLVVGAPLVGLGLIVLTAVAFEWAIAVWSEKATGDPTVNRAIRRRVMMPIEVPVLGALGIAAFVLAISRIMLALPKFGVYVLFGLVPAIVLAAAFAFSARPRINRSAVAALCLVGALAVLGGGVVAAVVGPQKIDPHEEEGGPGEEGGLSPIGAHGPRIAVPR